MAYLNGLSGATNWPPQKIVYVPPIPNLSLEDRVKLQFSFGATQPTPDNISRYINSMDNGQLNTTDRNGPGSTGFYVIQLGKGFFPVAGDLTGTGWKTVPLDPILHPSEGQETIIDGSQVRWHPKYGWIMPIAGAEAIIQHGYSGQSGTFFSAKGAVEVLAVSVAAAAGADFLLTGGASAFGVGVGATPTLSTSAAEQVAYNAAQAATETAATAMEPIVSTVAGAGGQVMASTPSLVTQAPDITPAVTAPYVSPPPLPEGVPLPPMATVPATTGALDIMSAAKTAAGVVGTVGSVIGTVQTVDNLLHPSTQFNDPHVIPPLSVTLPANAAPQNPLTNISPYILLGAGLVIILALRK
jgi:hypothetical protein